MSHFVKRLLVTVAVLVIVAAGCSTSERALRSGDVELSLSELIDELQELGVPIIDGASIIDRTAGDGSVEQPSFETAVSLLTIDLQIDDRLVQAGVDLGPQDYEDFNAARNLRLDFDPVDLPPISQLDYHLTVKVTVLSAATGVDVSDLIVEMYEDSEVDPRYGTMTSEGLEPRAGP